MARLLTAVAVDSAVVVAFQEPDLWRNMAQMSVGTLSVGKLAYEATVARAGDPAETSAPRAADKLDEVEAFQTRPGGPVRQDEYEPVVRPAGAVADDLAPQGAELVTERGALHPLLENSYAD